MMIDSNIKTSLSRLSSSLTSLSPSPLISRHLLTGRWAVSSPLSAPLCIPPRRCDHSTVHHLSVRWPLSPAIRPVQPRAAKDWAGGCRLWSRNC